MPSYTQPQEFSTGQILGRANLAILRDNDDYFNALADRWRCIPSGEYMTWSSGTSKVIWDGYHYLEADATTLQYYIGVMSTSAGTPVTLTLYYDYGGTSQVTITALSGTANGTWFYEDDSYDLGSFSSGLYRIYAVATMSGAPGGGALCHAPFTTYTSTSYSYGTPGYVTDGQVSAAGHFNRLRLNDLYFNACSPRQPGFCGQNWDQNPVAGQTESIIWDGWIRHRHETLQYSIDLDWTEPDSSSNTNVVRIYYDYDDTTSQAYTTISSEGTSTDSWDLTASTYATGTWYRVTVTMYRTNTAHKAAVKVLYLFTSPTEADSGFYQIGDYIIGQWVYGDFGSNVDIIRLQTNDANVFPRLCWNATVGRMDFGVKKQMSEDSDCSGGAFRVVHRYPWLYYRGTDLKLSWGTENSESLEDVSTGYGTVDLEAITDLAYGQVYAVEKRSDSGTLLFAMEHP